MWPIGESYIVVDVNCGSNSNVAIVIPMCKTSYVSDVDMEK